jgi:hypothetical protein
VYNKNKSYGERFYQETTGGCDYALEAWVFRNNAASGGTFPVSVQSLRTTVQRNQSYLATSPEKSKDVQRGPKMSKDV